MTHEQKLTCTVKKTIDRSRLSMTINYDRSYIRLDSTFDEPLENYFHIIRHICKILFYKINNDYYGFKRSKIISYSYPIILTKNITLLSLPDNYNHVVVLSKNTNCLILGDIYEKPLLLPKNFKSLTLGLSYNNQLSLGKFTERFIMGSSYNCMAFTTKNMKYLYIGYDYNCPIVLPKNLIHLEFYIDSDFNCQIILTKKLKMFKPHYNYGDTPNLIEYPIEKIHVPNRRFFRVYDNLPNGPSNYIISKGKNWLFNMPSKQT